MLAKYTQSPAFVKEKSNPSAYALAPRLISGRKGEPRGALDTAKPPRRSLPIIPGAIPPPPAGPLQAHAL